MPPHEGHSHDGGGPANSDRAHIHHHPSPTDSGVLHGSLRSGERRRLGWVLALTGLTMVAEIVGGVVTRSVSLLSDAFHMLTHFGAVGLSYAAIRMALRPSGPERTFRNWRLEVLASFFNAILLVPIAIWILIEAWQRVVDPVPVDVLPMLGVAFVGLLVNLVCAALLHRHSHHDLNVRGAFLHMLADTLSSVGVMAAGLLIWLGGSRFTWADPAAAALISVLILVWGLSLLRSSLRILLEAAPAHVRLDELAAAMTEMEEVEEVHDVHVWTITSKMHVLTAHVRLARDLPVSETEELGERLRTMLGRRFDINHATLQFETKTPEGAVCRHEHDPAAGL